MDYLLHLIVLVCIFSILAVSLDLLIGHTGLLSIAHAAFFGIGAYSAALLAIRLGAPFTLAILASMIVGFLASLLVSVPSLRLAGDYFAIATFGLQMILFSAFNNWNDLTRGPLGLSNIPHPNVLGIAFDSSFAFALFAISIAIVAYTVAFRTVRSPFGRVLHAIREDEVFAKSVGKATVRFKLTVCAVSATLAALAGSVYAYYMTFIDPTTFTALESILIIAIVIVGGAGSLWGPPIGALILVLLPEVLRFLGVPSGAGANLRQIVYGLLLVVLMIYRPQGLFGRSSIKLNP